MDFCKIYPLRSGFWYGFAICAQILKVMKNQEEWGIPYLGILGNRYNLEIDFLNSGKQKTLGRVMTKRFKSSLSLGVFFTNKMKFSTTFSIIIITYSFVLEIRLWIQQLLRLSDNLRLNPKYLVCFIKDILKLHLFGVIRTQLEPSFFRSGYLGTYERILVTKISIINQKTPIFYTLGRGNFPQCCLLSVYLSNLLSHPIKLTNNRYF